MEEKMDLSGLARVLGNLKETTLQSKDYCKFVIGISTGALIFSVTFAEKFSPGPVCKPMILIGWVCLVISIITGVWLLSKRDSLEAQWKTIMDLFSDPEKILFGIERDFNKLVTRALIGGFLKEESSKEPKNEEKIKKLRREWVTPNGSKGKAFLKATISLLEQIYPALASVTPDITKELELWGQLLTKHGKLLYLPDMLKKLRKSIIQAEFLERVMRVSFYAGIILITLFSAINFLEVDVIDLIRRLLSSIIVNSYGEPL